ncbi:protocadherin beta-15-like [Polypterus senegalus]|uniref:protocadherin beta-15-like n=1 Tax=Polypterus senegalus TaxID=55291 RepID=UPI0019650B6B|nr:protocadherin beta-15-like [Polypterus senegalus]
MLPWTLITQVPLVIVFAVYAFPVNAEVRYSIPEEKTRGAFIGDIAKDLGINDQRLKTGRAHIYTDGDTEYVELNVMKGILVVKDRIDREQICGGISPCLLQFQIVLENPMEFHRITIDVADINDNNPTFVKKNIRLEISELSLPGALFSLPSAVDSDIGVNTLKSYTLTKNDHFNIKTEMQNDGSSSVNLILETPLDREKQEELLLLLTAFDGGEPQRSGTIEINIIVLDANDNPPVFTQRVYKAALPEDSLVGSVVIRVNATDADKDTNGHIKYLLSHLTDNAQNIFEINPESGEIKLIGQIDYENKKMYEITVEAKDIGGLVSSSKVIIEIIDVNDNVPYINLMSVSNQISEDSIPGTTIAMIKVQDKDSGRNGKVSCSVNNNIPFKLSSSLNNFYTLQTDGFLDREKVSQYNITIMAKDDGEPSLSTTQTITLQISDVNDNAPKFKNQHYKTYVMENNTPGSSIFSVSAKDDDFGLNSRISYLLTETGINNISVSSFVSVNSDEGVLYAVRSFDYEQLSHFQITVTAKDKGSPPLSSSVIIDVYIQDQNDNHPEILYPVVHKGSLVAEFVPRSADVGYLVTKVVAVDKDSGQNAWLSFKLIKYTDQTLFEVGLHNGEVRTLRQIVEKDSTKQRITVLVEDSGQPSHSATANLNIAITDNLVMAFTEFGDLAREKSGDGDIRFYLVLALVIVSFIFIVFIIVLISLKLHKWRRSKLFNECSNGTLPVIPYYPPRYAEVGATGTLCHVYNYEVCLTTDSGKNEFKYVKPVLQSPVEVDSNGTKTTQRVTGDLIADEDLMQVRQITFLRFFPIKLF